MKKAKIWKAAALALLALTAGAAWAQTPEQIINAHLQAIGGKKAFKSIKNVRREGKVEIAAQGLSLDMVTYAMRPNLLRQEIQFQGATIVQACGGEKAWAINPLSGSDKPIEMPEPLKSFFLRTAFFDDLFFGNAEKRGVTLAYQGSEDQEGEARHHLKAVFSNGHEQHRFYDAKTGLIASIRQNQPSQTGQLVEVVTKFSDWRDVDGVKYPFRIETSAGQVVVFNKTETNVSIDKSIFVASSD